MESKKNPKADVRRNSSIYFAVGLVLMLFVAHYSINYRTTDRQADEIAKLEFDPLIEEIIPITEHPVTPPPVIPQPVIPDDFDIKEDDDDVIEHLIDTTEDFIDEPIVDVEDIVVVKPDDEPIEVPFVSIEDVPVFPGCENVPRNERRTCMSVKITNHVQNKFNTHLAEGLDLTGKQRIYVLFKIDKNGDIIEIHSRAPHSILGEEATRVINLLPKMQPGKQRGEAVTVKYTLPIIFEVQN